MGGAGDGAPTTAGQDGRLGGGLGPPRSGRGGGGRRSECPRGMKIKRHTGKEADGPSPKHFLSEEAMAERFTCLSLGNDHVYSTNGFPVSRRLQGAGDPDNYIDPEDRLGTDGEPDATGRDVELDGMFDMADSRVLVLSPDLQLELNRPLNILPPEVLQSLNRPCTELLLWQPPGTPVHRAIQALRLGDSGRKSGGGDPSGRKKRVGRAEGPVAEEEMDI